MRVIWCDLWDEFDLREKGPDIESNLIIYASFLDRSESEVFKRQIEIIQYIFIIFFKYDNE